jgi:hypothetical protein
MEYAAHSAYGPWLAMMMNIKRVDSRKLAEKANISPQELDDLIEGKVEPERAKEGVFRIGEILLSESPQDRMERVLRALDVHTDLRNWSESCDGGCCAWNIVTEIAGDPALEAMGVR